MFKLDTDHAVEEIKSSQSYRLILIIQTLEYEVLVRLDTLWMGLEYLGHCHQT